MPADVLQKQTATISEITPEIKKLAANMRETMHNAQGVGLAAPQVGQLISLCVVEYVDEDGEGIPYMVLINPRITWKSPRQVSMEEACLSIPGVEGMVQRPQKVRVKALNLDGDTVEITADGLLARVLQHEIDHLHGKLFTDYVPKRKLQKRPLVDYPTV
jgi:peptide deformylase